MQAPNYEQVRNSISNKSRIIEISAVVITGLGKFIFMDWLNWRLPYISIAIVGWFTYIIYRQRTTKNILSYWGFRTDNFKSVFLLLLPFGLVSVITFFIVGYVQDTLNITWHILPILIIYPLWGTMQQFLMIGLIAGNLHDLDNSPFSKLQIILINAALFSVVHYPNYWLVIGTFILALLYGWIYLKSRNVFVLGIFHGWLGGLFYYTVVNRDPFIEVFGKHLN